MDRFDRLFCRLGVATPTSWDDVRAGRVTRLYAGSLDWDDGDFSDCYDMRLAESSLRNLIQNVSAPLPIADNTINSVMGEDVPEYPPYQALPAILDEISRVPKPGGWFRMNVPDFRNPLYWNRSIKAADGTLPIGPGGPFRGRQGGGWRHYLVSG